MVTTSDSVIHLRPRKAEGERVLLTKEQAAERLQVSSRTIERWMARGRIPHVRPNPDSPVVRFPADALDELLAKRTVRAR